MTDEQKMKQMTRRSLMWAGVSVFAAGGVVRWLLSQDKTTESAGFVFRKVHETNEKVNLAWFDYRKSVGRYRTSDITPMKVNGPHGLGQDFDVEKWTLRLEGMKQEPITLSIDQIKALPRVEMVTQFCCVEGWSAIQSWAGVRLRDLCAVYAPATTDGGAPDWKEGKNIQPYVSMETPDGEYFVGLDAASAFHPDTILAYERDGKPLTVKGSCFRIVEAPSNKTAGPVLAATTIGYEILKGGT